MHALGASFTASFKYMCKNIRIALVFMTSILMRNNNNMLVFFHLVILKSQVICFYK